MRARSIVRIPSRALTGAGLATDTVADPDTGMRTVTRRLLRTRRLTRTPVARVRPAPRHRAGGVAAAGDEEEGAEGPARLPPRSAMTQ